jgi:zinc transporter
MMTPRDILADLTERQHGPKAAPELFLRLAERLTERMNSVIVRLDEQLDEIEARLESENHAPLRRELVDLRQSIVALRRYLGPQREALSSLQIDAPTWLDANHRIALREIGDRLLRYLEDLDAARERAVVVKDEITNHLAETMNRTMFALSIVASVFLPLGFITGLLGINVGGMPGVESAYAFWITCGLLVVLVIGEVYLLKKLKWIGK